MNFLFPHAPKISTVRWALSNPYWIKINTDGTALGSPCLADGGGVFQNSRGFIKGCFSIPLGTIYAFEAKMIIVMYALEVAKANFGIVFGLKVI